MKLFQLNGVAIFKYTVNSALYYLLPDPERIHPISTYYLFLILRSSDYIGDVALLNPSCFKFKLSTFLCFSFDMLTSSYMNSRLLKRFKYQTYGDVWIVMSHVVSTLTNNV